MQGVEISHLNAAIAAALKAYYDFRNSTVEDALRPISRYGKRDTLGMDAGPEITICQELTKYDAGAVVVTEEIGSQGLQISDSFRSNDPQTFRTVFISDPTDRSNQLKAFLVEFPKDTTIGKIMGNPEVIKKWEKKNSNPASITGSTSAISCVRRGLPIFSVIVNYITQQLIISCAAGNRVVDLPEKRPQLVDFNYVYAKGTKIIFPNVEDESISMQKFVTFLGDTGKVGYSENFRDSDLINEKEKEDFLHYGIPGGPSRILYLSAFQPKNKQIGFILYNGEKIGEWIHCLSFIRFAKNHTDESQPALMIYEISQNRPWTKEGVLMSTPPNYSVFRKYNDKMYIDTSWLLKMPNPSQLRSTLIIAPHNNRWAVRSSSQLGYRPLVF